MKPSAILINMARGGIVDELDLANAINNDLIAGACFDVFTKEPILAENPLLQIKDKQKIVLAPHTAWISVEARTLLIEKIAGNIREYQENQ
jgi:glycerate dehydrogenase